MPNINKMLLKSDRSRYATSLDLNMGYYHIQISEDASNFCKIILPWIKYHYKHLPIGGRNSPDMFQQKMKDFFQEFEFLRA